MKWQHLKNKLIDFFFKEVEVDDEEEIRESYGTPYGTEKYRLSTLDDDKSEVKVRYQYPSTKATPFRFPVIPDERAAVFTTYKTNEAKSELPTNRSFSESDEQLFHLERRQSSANHENDEVPAYMRRERRNHDKFSISNEDTDVATETTATTNDVLPHTKPAELDAVFKKRDGKGQSDEQGSKPSIKKEPMSTDKKALLKQELSNRKQRATANHSEVNMAQKEVATTSADPKEHRATEESEVTQQTPASSSFTRLDDVEMQQQFYSAPVEAETETVSSPVPDYLLNDQPETSMIDEDWLIEQQILLEDTFTHFNIDATVVNVTQGPSVTRFEIQPALGVKVSKIKNLSDDLKLNLAAEDIRIEAPIPGKNTIGIEIPNETMHLVNLQEIFESENFKEATSPLTIALGLTIEGEPIISNIDKMPHGLIAGATGSGKSVCINTIILSLLYKANYQDVKLLLIDPKMVELAPYNNIPHLIAPVITDTKAATKALKWAVDEMENRYQKFVELGVRNIQKFNEKVQQGQTSYDKMPSIVIIIDELADLMMMSPQEVEDAICRIAQKARACGIHLLLATQRPSVDVITGLIKANIPTRIAFSVSSQVDSRTMIDTGGAEKLLGKGDMLFVENGAGKAVRLQGPFVSDDEIERVAAYARSIAEPEYLFEEEQLLTFAEEEEEDELLEDIIRFVVSHEQASTSLLQRQFRIGYNRAARLIDSLESKGIISGQNGSKPREVLVTEEQIENI